MHPGRLSYQKIYKDLYRVRVSNLALLDPDDIVNQDLTDAEMSRTSIVHLPIWNIASIANDGFSISLVNRDDLHTLIEAIENHLTISNGLPAKIANQTDHFIDRLRVLDDFMDSVSMLNTRTIVSKINTRPSIGGFGQLPLINMEANGHVGLVNPDKYVRKSALSKVRDPNNVYDISNIF